MRTLIFLACALASATATLYSPYYDHHVPVIGHNGVPIETPEVQAAKASHFAAHAAARSGHVGLGHAPVSFHGYGFHGLTHNGFQGLTHNGLPLDTPEVAAAKLQHHADYAAAAHRNGVHSPGHFYSAHPVDTPEVQLAKSAHFAAYAEAAARNGVHGHYRKRRGIYGAAYPQHIPVIGPNGVPIDTPEVQAARASHLEALHAAGGAHGHSPAYYSGGYESAVGYHGAHDVSVVAAGGHGYPGYHAQPWRYTEPAQIGHNGQPIETPEVQHRKAEHFAAHAKLGNYYYH